MRHLYGTAHADYNYYYMLYNRTIHIIKMPSAAS